MLRGIYDLCGLNKVGIIGDVVKNVEKNFINVEIWFLFLMRW